MYLYDGYKYSFCSSQISLLCGFVLLVSGRYFSPPHCSFASRNTTLRSQNTSLEGQTSASCESQKETRIVVRDMSTTIASINERLTTPIHQSGHSKLYFLLSSPPHVCTAVFLGSQEYHESFIDKPWYPRMRLIYPEKVENHVPTKTRPRLATMVSIMPIKLGSRFERLAILQ